METAGEVWGEGIEIRRYQKRGGGCMRWKRPLTTAVDDVPCGVLLVTSESDDILHHMVQEFLERSLQDCQQRVSPHYSDYRIFLMYILDEVWYGTVLKYFITLKIFS